MITCVSFDLETGGDDSAYGLQPWRVARHQAWINSYAVGEIVDGAIQTRSLWRPTVERLREELQGFVDSGVYVVCACLVEAEHGFTDLIGRHRRSHLSSLTFSVDIHELGPTTPASEAPPNAGSVAVADRAKPCLARY